MILRLVPRIFALCLKICFFLLNIMDYKLTTIPSPLDGRDWSAECIYNSRSLIPNEFDMRPMLSPVRDQGNQGTCAAQTAACIKEIQEKKDVNFSGYMSPQFIYNNRQNQDSEGMYGRDVMRILSDIGSCKESTYEYGIIQKPDDIPKEAFKEANRHKIRSFARVNTINGAKQALYNDGPCYIAFPVYNYGPEFWKKRHVDDKFLGGHAVTIVGYTKDSFIIRNTWGKKWADKGYTYYKFKDYGSHWEIWTTVDEESGIFYNDVIDDIKPKCCPWF